MSDETPVQIGSPVKDFVKSFLQQAEEGIREQGFIPCSEPDANVKIELNATEVREAGGGLKIHIFNLSGKASDTNTQKMTIFARKYIKDLEEAERKAKIAEANAKETDAKLKKKFV